MADIVDICARCGKLGRHMRVHRRHVFFAVETARDAGLVCHDKDEVALLVEQLDSLARAVDPAEARDVPDIALVVSSSGPSTTNDCIAFGRSSPSAAIVVMTHGMPAAKLSSTLPFSPAP